jgi:hypothetical protein
MPMSADREVIRLSFTRARHPRQVTLDVGEEDGHALLDELLGHELEGLGLAGSGGAGDEAVAVHRRQRDRTFASGWRPRR